MQAKCGYTCGNAGAEANFFIGEVTPLSGVERWPKGRDRSPADARVWTVLSRHAQVFAQRGTVIVTVAQIALLQDRNDLVDDVVRGRVYRLLEPEVVGDPGLDHVLQVVGTGFTGRSGWGVANDMVGQNLARRPALACEAEGAGRTRIIRVRPRIPKRCHPADLGGVNPCNRRRNCAHRLPGAQTRTVPFGSRSRRIDPGKYDHPDSLGSRGDQESAGVSRRSRWFS